MLVFIPIKAQTLINTSFESSDNYNIGTIHTKNKWTVTSGTGEIVSTADYIKDGNQALKISSSSSAIQVDHIAYPSNAIALTGDVYLDFWIKLISYPSVNFGISGYDLGTLTNRSFLLEFQTNGKIKLFDGSSGWATQPVYGINTWKRISIKIDNSGTKCQYAIDGVVINKLFSFREIKTGATTFDFHSLRFIMDAGTANVAIDNIYIGSNPIPDIVFQSSSTERTISLSQPTYGTITLTPSKTKYELNEQVTASISIPEHYVFSGWSGNLTGTENPKIFTVSGNMTIGATVIVDAANPPAQSTIIVNQPVGATITLTPQQTSFYNGTSISAQLTLQSGYQFNGWAGSLAGKTNPVNFVINESMTIGADVSEIQVSSTKRIVSNVTQFKEAIAAMNPGDTVYVLDGIYALGGVKINRGGSGLKPVIIKSANLHGAKITGASSFSLSAVSYVTFEGFEFDIEPMSTIFKMEGCSYVRITRNWMKMKTLSTTQTSKWITVGEIWENPVCNSHHNRIDHNLFDGKYDSGAWVVIDGSHGLVPDISKHDRIDHNIFCKNTPRVANEKETLRIGVSDLSNLNSYTVVENNLFEDCDGDPEYVSIKSCSDTVRFNTFRRCLGTLSLRHGNNSVVEGNFIFGDGKTGLFEGSTIGCGGIRVYGMNHKIFNNYMEGLTGSKWDAACTITNGDVTNTSTSLTSHFIPENILFNFNTLVNNVSNIEIGFDNNASYGKAPKNCRIENNIVLANVNPIIKSFSPTSLAGVSFSNNIMFSTGTSSLGLTGISESQIKTINPELVKTNCRANNANCNFVAPFEIYKLSGTSPAINNSIGNDIPLFDMERQPTITIRDIGADEYNGNDEVKIGPLNNSHVGPSAPEQYSYEQNSTDTKSIVLSGKTLVFVNKTNKNLSIVFPQLLRESARVLIINSLGQILSNSKIAPNTQQAEIEINTTGIILCKIEYKEKIESYKLIIQ